jgi:hypothetical protein
MASSSEVVIREARADEMSLVRELFLEYASSLGFDLSFQNFDEKSCRPCRGSIHPHSDACCWPFAGAKPRVVLDCGRSTRAGAK